MNEMTYRYGRHAKRRSLIAVVVLVLLRLIKFFTWHLPEEKAALISYFREQFRIKGNKLLPLFVLIS